MSANHYYGFSLKPSRGARNIKWLCMYIWGYNSQRTWAGISLGSQKDADPLQSNNHCEHDRSRSQHFQLQFWFSSLVFSAWRSVTFLQGDSSAFFSQFLNNPWCCLLSSCQILASWGSVWTIVSLQKLLALNALEAKIMSKQQFRHQHLRLLCEGYWIVCFSLRSLWLLWNVYLWLYERRILNCVTQIYMVQKSLHKRPPLTSTKARGFISREQTPAYY